MRKTNAFFKRKICMIPGLMAALLLAGSCGTNLSRENEPDTFIHADTANRNSVELFDQTLPSDEWPPITITWGYENTGSAKTLMPDNSDVVKKINSLFNITLKAVEIPSNNAWEEAVAMPDIFFVHDVPYAERTGLFRTIPADMIRRYAPGYAALLNREAYGWALNKVGDDDAYTGLSPYIPQTQLKYLSAYRLDWLNQLGIAPKGEPVKIDDRIYFTETAFTEREWMDILYAFTLNDPDQNGLQDTYGTRSINGISEFMNGLGNWAGMWGFNSGNINDGGQANVFYASERYKAFLLSYVNLYVSGVIKKDTTRTSADIGWWVLNIDETFNPENNNRSRSAMNRTLGNNSDSILLLTPPEIGTYGQGSAHASKVSPFNARYNLFMVSNQVSDEKLIRLLQVFNAVSFDPEIKLLATYGVEAANFQWLGEPYHSRIYRINRDVSVNEGYNLLNTHIYDEVAGKWMYDNGLSSPLIYAYSVSDIGQSYTLPPYKEDVLGEYMDEVLDWNAKYEARTMKVAGDYFSDITEGLMHVEDTWDAYINTLNIYGLRHYQQILAQYE